MRKRYRSGRTSMACSPPIRASSRAAIASRASHSRKPPKWLTSAPKFFIRPRFFPPWKRIFRSLILNSRRPDVGGTRITSEAVPCRNAVKSISCKRNITILNIRSTRMLMAHGFLRRIFEIFDRYETSVDMVSTSEVSVSLTVDNTGQPAAHLSRARAICRVKRGGRSSHRLPGRREYSSHARYRRRERFKCFDGTNIRMISQGASLLNLGFVIADRRSGACRFRAPSGVLLLPRSGSV